VHALYANFVFCEVLFSAACRMAENCIKNQYHISRPLYVTVQPVLLIQESIDRLEQLSDFLSGEVHSTAGVRASLLPEQRISKETLLTISVLLPKLHQIRSAHAQSVSAGRQCPYCED
jgi:hypothetical protein